MAMMRPSGLARVLMHASSSQGSRIRCRPFATQSALEKILKERGLSNESAYVVSEALKTASSLEEERKILAQTLPLTALKQMEQSMQDMADLRKPEDCTVRVRIANENGREFIVKGRTGETFVDLVKRGTELKDYLECACGGNMTCSTCQVYVREPKEVAEGASAEEKDMLDLAFEPIDDVSRLSCQIKLQPDIKLVVEIPKQAFNHFK